MKILGQVLGAVGLVLLLSTPVMYFAVAAGWNRLFTVQLVLAALFLFSYALTNAGELRRIATGRGTFYLAFTLASSLALVALLVSANYLAHAANMRRDLTRARVFTLAEDSVRTAKAMPEPVEVLAFYRSDTAEYRYLEELVSRYRRAGGELGLLSIDPDREPNKVREHGINMRGGRVVVRMGGSTERITEISEEALTNALVRLTRGVSRRVYFTTGHGESRLDDEEGDRGLFAAWEMMDNEGIDARPLLLTDAVPDDASALVVAGPQRALLAPEVELISEYLVGGGRVLVLLEPSVGSGLEELLESWGIGVEDDLIVDRNRVSQQMGPFVTLAASYALHPITEAFGATITLFPTSRSLFALNAEGRRRPLPLALTGESAFGAKGYREVPVEYQPETDRRGPLPIALVTSAASPSGAWSDEARLMVFGDSDFATNAWAKQAANADLFLNSLNWLVDRTDRLTIRPRQREASQIFLTQSQQLFLSMFSINILPLLLAAMGVAVWVLRKNR